MLEVQWVRKRLVSDKYNSSTTTKILYVMILFFLSEFFVSLGFMLTLKIIFIF